MSTRQPSVDHRDCTVFAFHGPDDVSFSSSLRNLLVGIAKREVWISSFFLPHEQEERYPHKITTTSFIEIIYFPISLAVGKQQHDAT